MALALRKEKHDTSRLQHVENSCKSGGIPGRVEHTAATRRHGVTCPPKRNYSYHPNQQSCDPILEQRCLRGEDYRAR